MKIEKMNEHQIRCTLTKEDLATRNIKLSELAYGSENAKLLFRDMMQQAAMDFGFEAEDIPLMIEAIPLSPEKIVLIITKVESPDELDTRFSNFTHFDDEDEDFDDDIEEELPFGPEGTASELLELFQQLKKEQALEQQKDAKEEAHAPAVELVRVFTAKDLDSFILAAHKLDGFYHGKNTLYKNQTSGDYHLILHQSKHSISDFNRINNVLCAYLTPQKYTTGIEAFYEEHLKVIVPNHALQSLNEIS
jgi:adapter protein MecA 1/2